MASYVKYLYVYLATIMSTYYAREAGAETPVHFPSLISGLLAIQTPSSWNSNSTSVGYDHVSYGPARPDLGNIMFQYDNSSTLWEKHIDKIIARGILQFALKINHELFVKEDDGSLDHSNIVFSPANIAVTLAMVMLGSSGSTYTEIANVLGLLSGINLVRDNDELHYHFGRLLRNIIYNGSQDPIRATMAGGIFIQNTFPVKERFVKLSREVYGSDIISIDFVGSGYYAKDVINNWVKNKTEGQIEYVLDKAPPPSTRVIIISTLYFNGGWEYPFPVEQTSWQPFYTEDTGKENSGETLQVMMMKNGADFPYYSDPLLGCQVVGLPYKNRTATLYLVLPNEGGYQGLRHLQYRLTVEHLKHLADSARERTVIIAVPRMKLESTVHLQDILKSLGVHTLFDPFHANLNEISDSELQYKIDSRSLFPNISEEIDISKKHDELTHTLINIQDGNSTSDKIPEVAVNETDSQGQENIKNISFNTSERSGLQNFYTNPKTQLSGSLYVDYVIHKVTVDITETGTVASAATVVSVTRDGSHKVVRFDRPFLFFIRHEATGIILFWGSVVRPTPNQTIYPTK